MKKIIIAVIILFSVNSIIAQQNENISIIPKPVYVNKTPGNFAFNDSVKIYCVQNPEMNRLADLLINAVNSASGLNLKHVLSDKREGIKNFIELRIDESLKNVEAYNLKITPDSIVIVGASDAGIFYGLQSLFQLFPINHESNLALPCVNIEDYPRFKWRGMHLDVCRHFFPVEFIRKYIDILAMYKLNTFHWHLTEDQGWRIEIKKYPKLTEVGAWRKETAGDGKPYGGFYTQEQIKDIVEYAKKRYITIVPEIEMPGHALAALAAYPELSCTGGPFEVGTTWGVFEDVYCAGNEKTFQFLEDVLDEVISLFPGKYIHIGGDEVPKTRWEKCEKCQARIKAEGLKNEHELQSYFIQRIEKYLNSKGKRIIGWDEILEGGLAKNAAVMSWRGTEGGIAAAKQHHFAVMSPGDYCYFDHYQGLSGEPKAFGGYTPLEKVYSYEPVPDKLDSIEAKYIIGAQANMWTEYIETPEHVEYMLLPRMCALSEVLWSPKSERNFSDFLSRMTYHYEMLMNKKINFRVPPPINKTGEYPITKNEKITLTSSIPGSKIYYTVDGSEPDNTSSIYTGPLTFENEIVLKAKTFLPNGMKSPTSELDVSIIDTTENGLYYKYYTGEWTSIPKFNEIRPESTGRVHKISFNTIKNRDDYFGIYFYGFIKIEDSGEYTFYLTSDDGSKLALNNNVVIDNDGLHGSKEVSGKTYLNSGLIPIAILYFENTGSQELKLEYEGPDIPRKVVPADKLFFDLY